MTLHHAASIKIMYYVYWCQYTAMRSQVDIFTVQLIISKVTAHKHLYLKESPTSTRHIVSRWDTTSYLPDIGKATIVKVLTMGKNFHYNGHNDVARDEVLK